MCSQRARLDVEIPVEFGVTEFPLYVFALGELFISRVRGVIFYASSTEITAYGIVRKKPITFYLIAIALSLTKDLFSLISNSFSFFFIPGLIVLIALSLLAFYLYHRT